MALSQCLCGLCTAQLLFISLHFHPVFCGGEILGAAIFKKRRVMHHLFKSEISPEIISESFKRDFSVLLYLYQYRLVDIYFILLGYIPIPLYFLGQIVTALFLSFIFKKYSLLVEFQMDIVFSFEYFKDITPLSMAFIFFSIKSVVILPFMFCM